jgi:penicillin-binding protein 2
VTRAILHAEAPKAFPYAASWYTGDNIEMAFGQGETVLTPIEQAVSYSTFANWSAATGTGTRFAPQVGSEIVDPLTGKVIKKLAPQVTGHVAISPANHQAILTGLEGVITSGTGAGAFQGFPANWNMAGKTGTASNQPGQEPNSWFVAFGPNPNPQYLVLAVIAQGGYGAQAAAPLVRNIFNYIYSNQDQVAGAVKTPTPVSPPSVTEPPSSPPLGTPTTTTTTTPGTTPAAGTTPLTTPPRAVGG